MFLANRHVTLALLVAPVLAIISYFAVDAAVSEKPQAATSGVSYALAVKPNCRYTSGICGLKNGDFELQLTPVAADGGGNWLRIESRHALSGGRMGFAAAATAGPADAPSAALQPLDSAGRIWQVSLPAGLQEDDAVQLAVAAAGSVYYAETGLTFTRYETSFARDFRQAN
jgi:hypothetical protein